MTRRRPTIGWRPFSPTPLQASARLRCYLPAEALGRAGYRSVVLTRPEPAGCDVVVFQKAYSDADFDLARRCRDAGVATVLDLCDNHLYNPAGRPDYAERAARLLRMIDAVDLVTVSTPELGKTLPRDECPVIDDALEPLPVGWRRAAETARLAPRFLNRRSRVRLLWFGNVGVADPRFGMIDLADRLPELTEFGRRHPFELTVVSNCRRTFEGYFRGAPFPTRYLSWNPWRVAAVARFHHVCLLPIGINPFTICKTSNRLVFALRLGLPVVADGIPSYREFAPYVTLDDWRGGLTGCAEARTVMRERVEAGRQFVRTRFDRVGWVEQWKNAIVRAIGLRSGATSLVAADGPP